MVNYLGVSHIGIGTRDLPRSVAFYRDVLGLVLVDEVEFEQAADLTGADRPTVRRAAYFRLGDLPGPPILALGTCADDDRRVPPMLDGAGIHHIAVWVDELPAVEARLRSASADIFWGPHHLTDYVIDVPARTERTERRCDVDSLFVRDPDGNCLQVEQRVVGNPNGYPVPG